MSQQLALVKSQNALPSTISPNQEIDIFKLGDVFAKSGMFEGVRDASQAIVKILAGREMGFQPFESMSNVHIIKGKPSIGAHLIAAAIKKSNRYRYKVLRQDNEACEIEFSENEGSGFQTIGKSSFTIQDARTAELLGNPVWKKFPKNMLFNRAMSNGAKSFCPDVFGGAIYTPEELGANVDGDGDIIPSSANVASPIRAVEPEVKSVDEKQPEEPSMFDEMAFEIAKEGKVVKKNGYYNVDELNDTDDLMTYRVSQKKQGDSYKAVCNCDSFVKNIEKFDNYRCIHIRAVKVAATNNLVVIDGNVDAKPVAEQPETVNQTAQIPAAKTGEYAEWTCSEKTAKRICTVVNKLAILPEKQRITVEEAYSGLREQFEDSLAPQSLDEDNAVKVAEGLEAHLTRLTAEAQPKP